MTSADEMKGHLRALPFAAFDTICSDTALIVAPHPDDESLGCGGFIAEACLRNRPPVVVILTDGTGSHPRSQTHPLTVLRALREQEAGAAVQTLGLPLSRLHFLRLTDTKAPKEGAALERAATQIAALAKTYHCSTLFTSWAADPHCDHVAAGCIAGRAAAILKCRLLAYPVWAWTINGDDVVELADPLPKGYRLNIEQHLEKKSQAIAAHASQYTDLIHDDPTGFRLPEHLMAQFEEPYEVFIRVVDA